MKKNAIAIWAVMLAFLFTMHGTNSLLACTDFQVKAADGTITIGRSMEFALELRSKILVHPRGDKRRSEAPGSKEGLAWTSKYGFVAVNLLDLDVAVDGVNEAGLSVGLLWFPGTKYQEVKAREASRAIAIEDFGTWILGNFTTVAEVKEAIQEVRVWGKFIPELGIVPPAHAAVHDANGNNLVIEFIDGEQKAYDNPNGVLTNAPTFDWQMTNLRNYVNLTALNAGPVNLAGTVLGPTGQGSGLLGIPGDWTPPSRFVRATAFIHFADPAKNAAEGVNLAQHILNTVDIPRGTIKDKVKGHIEQDYTQWVVVKDLTHRVMYFRSYEDLSLRAVDLKKLNLNSGAKTKSLSIGSGSGIVDITDKLR